MAGDSMIEFTIGIAGRRVRIRAMYDFAKEFCKSYLTEGEPDFTVEISPSDIEFEREKAAREDEYEGREAFDYQPDYLETLAIYRKIVVKMLDYDTFLFHGSAISVDGEGYLFTAKSGTGKSTHTSLWKKIFRHHFQYVNDDKPLLWVKDDQVIICGTPWDGKHRLSTNVMVPLKGLILLERGEKNEITPVDPGAAFPLLLQQSYRPNDPVAVTKTLQLLQKTMKIVRIFRLKCTISGQAVFVAYKGINGKDYGT